MRTRLSIGDINARSPYKVWENAKDGSLCFETAHGVDITVDFIDDLMITSGDSYQLIIANTNNKPSPRDAKLKETILCIVGDFFDKNQAAVLYICETGDGKQRMRSRLFSYWFEAYEYNTRFSMHTASVRDEEGMENFAALIVRNDNPHIVEIVSEFTQTAKILRDKPSGQP